MLFIKSYIHISNPMTNYEFQTMTIYNAVISDEIFVGTERTLDPDYEGYEDDYKNWRST